ncbi:MAG: cell division protein FtsH [Candidatus Taylorbacteria bacterium RIFCSPHIGHO2_02_FULL_47_18]|uniref:ATP-dependent zinc metalloprotease FtsH n=1 Tax=Candidatus Taylorbacteria bacterium RIFCSPLOWO2_01_FULL_48_100 TaxID=1802322 RepID=A0A1G2NIJ4_9BACT|nr:MAG: cell division protein FtsH [Candidatus Taylorbacteria bacterium RIFCSPHIGHO2_02_FULL_47_18]OHA35162.1 MAG: cell division protein FtsH [Candidatus Taylorbacteria bacterium RIFCSPLOWO2_01_FULL_48_100]OHA41121.1 MAG: cell division protein FtsH [Candidatus Taylorbacteria bacterium RIFCSPLOWO2_02_FULL_48_16]OHA45283.1 MAG: cell division protein FtsH [Candidatus Taylorbacteria bacterium RIFCSPLOWO2_12_FULL_48_11]
MAPLSLARHGAVALLIFLTLTSAYSFLTEQNGTREEIALSALAADITSGKVVEIIARQDEIEAIYKDTKPDAPHIFAKKEAGVSVTETLQALGVPEQKLGALTLTVKRPSGFSYWFGNIAPFLLPILLLAFLIWFLSRQVRGAGMQALSFGQSKARIIFPHDKKQKVSFKDVAGAKEAKEELKEIVDFLKNPKKFLDIGAQIPKGVLLMGASGTGKTLLARAVAGEANVPFFSISGSEFVEMFVGVGASRVRDLFNMAKKSAPSIIFIDEIDAVGRVRGGGMGGGNDEREQTLNQILVELDGFEPTDRLVVMAATNRPDVLDPALVRPGRFDRRVVVDLPDRGDREEILKIHARGKPLFEDVNLRVIAERTPGFSGADLYSLMNESAILAARENRATVTQYDLIRSIEKVMLGPERRSHLLSVKEKEITAYHEAGHALAASVLEHADPVHKVSIISRGRAAGYTLKLPIEDRKLQSRKEFLDDIAVSLGGFVAEKMLFDDLTTGSSNDLAVATALARDMVTRYGMSDKIGPIALEESAGLSPFGGEYAAREYSEKVGSVVDSEVARIMSEAEGRATDILKKHRKALDTIAKKLIEVETIERDEFEKLLIANGIVPKKKQEI